MINNQKTPKHPPIVMRALLFFPITNMSINKTKEDLFNEEEITQSLSSGTIAVMPASCIVLSQRFTASIKQLRSVFCIEFSNLA